MTPIELSAERGRLRLHLRCLPLGDDLCVTLSGGDREHIGAVALSQPGPARATTSVLALPGHREDELARGLAARLAAHLGTTVCVACGIHLDAIQPSELAAVAELTEELTQALLARLPGLKPALPPGPPPSGAAGRTRPRRPGPPGR